MSSNVTVTVQTEVTSKNIRYGFDSVAQIIKSYTRYFTKTVWMYIYNLLNESFYSLMLNSVSCCRLGTNWEALSKFLQGFCKLKNIFGLFVLFMIILFHLSLWDVVRRSSNIHTMFKSLSMFDFSFNCSQPPFLPNKLALSS